MFLKFQTEFCVFTCAAPREDKCSTSELSHTHHCVCDRSQEETWVAQTQMLVADVYNTTCDSDSTEFKAWASMRFWWYDNLKQKYHSFTVLQLQLQNLLFWKKWVKKKKKKKTNKNYFPIEHSLFLKNNL